MATSAEFFVAIIFCSYGIKLSGYFGLLVRVQMAVGLHGSLHPFVSQAFCYQKRCTAHVNQQTGVGMAHIMHPDLLCSGVVTTILHLSADPASIVREDTVCRLYLVKLCQIVFQAVFQHLRHNNFTIWCGMNGTQSTRRPLPRKNEKQPVSVIWMSVAFHRVSDGKLLLGRDDRSVPRSCE